MTHTDNIAITLAILNNAKKHVADLLANSPLGDRKVTNLTEAMGEIQDAINGVSDYQSEYNSYVNSGQAAEDFREGEVLRAAEFRDE